MPMRTLLLHSTPQQTASLYFDTLKGVTKESEQESSRLADEVADLIDGLVCGQTVVMLGLTVLI